MRSWARPFVLFLSHCTLSKSHLSSLTLSLSSLLAPLSSSPLIPYAPPKVLARVEARLAWQGP